MQMHNIVWVAVNAEHWTSRLCRYQLLIISPGSKTFLFIIGVNDQATSDQRDIVRNLGSVGGTSTKLVNTVTFLTRQEWLTYRIVTMYPYE